MDHDEWRRRAADAFDRRFGNRRSGLAEMYEEGRSRLVYEGGEVRYFPKRRTYTLGRRDDD